MQAIDSAVVPLFFESNVQLCDWFAQSQVIMNDFACAPLDELQLIKQLENYCLCDTAMQCVCESTHASVKQPCWSNFFDGQLNMNYSNFKTKVQLYDERISYLCNLLDQVFDCDSVIVKQAKKIQRKCRSQRRSSYIGVSKNGPNWQAMISVEKRKSYIGTYVSEVEAAQAFDFYSLLIHGFSAKTNFSYSKTDIVNLISRFQTLSQ